MPAGFGIVLGPFDSGRLHSQQLVGGYLERFCQSDHAGCRREAGLGLAIRNSPLGGVSGCRELDLSLPPRLADGLKPFSKTRLSILLSRHRIRDCKGHPQNPFGE